MHKIGHLIRHTENLNILQKLNIEQVSFSGQTSIKQEINNKTNKKAINKQITPMIWTFLNHLLTNS